MTSPLVPTPVPARTPAPVATRTPTRTPTPQALGPIVALGDSITYGYGTGVTTAAYGPAPLHSYPWDMARDLGIPVINAGISGTTAQEVLDPASQPTITRPVALRLPALLALRPRLMVVGFGSNEANLGWSIGDTVAAFDQLLGRITAAHVPIVLVGTHVDCAVQPCSASRRTYTTAWMRR